MRGTPTLKESASATLELPVQGRLLEFEPRTELVAYVDSQSDVCITRIGGQRTATIDSEQLHDARPSCIQWHIGGKALHVGTDQGKLYSIDAEATKPVATEIASKDSSMSQRAVLRCLGRVVNSSISISSRSSEPLQDIDSWLSRIQLDQDTGSNQKSTLLDVSQKDLPQRLAMIDVESLLPRLGPISHAAGVKFVPMPGRPLKTTTAPDLSWQVLSQPALPDIAIEFQVNARADCSASLEIGSTFRRDITFTTHSDSNPQREPIKHCAHSGTSFHAVLLADTRSEMSSPSLAIFQNPFSLTGGQHTPLISSKSSQLLGLKLYLSYCIDHLATEWNTHSTLPARFIENIGEELNEKGEGDLTSQLFMLAMTGHSSPIITEWLKDVLQERGHKRWDTAMTNLYSSMSQILQHHITPALERCALVASQLRGFATYYAGSKQFDVDADVFSAIIDAVTCAQAVAHEMMRICSREGTLYRVFSKWLRKQIDLAGMEIGSAGAIEAAETEATSTDVTSLLEYLQGPLTKSGLGVLVRSPAPAEEASNLRLEEITTAIGELQAGTGEHDAPCLSLPVCARAVISTLGHAFDRINIWQSSIWKAPQIVDIDISHTFSVFDTRMSTRSDPTSPAHVLFTANDTGAPGELSITYIMLGGSLAQGSRDGKPQRTATLRFEPGGEIVDACIMGDERILCLMRHGRQAQLLSVPALDYEAIAQSGSSEIQPVIIHEFDKSGSFVPAQIRVTETEHKQNVLVLDQEQRTWKILDMRHGTGCRSVRAVLSNKS